MKLARKAYWLFSALALAGVFWAGWAVLDSGAQAVSHLTRAQLLTQNSTGFTLPSYAMAAGLPEGRWSEVELPHAPRPWLAPGGMPKESEALTQITWYKLALPGREPFAAARYLYIPRWKSDGQIAVYGDGRLLYRSHANLQWNGSNRPLWIALNDTADAPAPHEILIRLQHLRGIGGALSSLWVGPHDALVWRYQVRDWLQAQLPFMSSSAFLAVGVFTLFVWLARRRERLYLLFFVMSVAAYVRTLHYYAGLERLPISDEWFGWLTVNSLFWLVATTHLFLVQLHRRVQPWLTRLVLGTSVAASVITLPLPGLVDATLVAPLIYVSLLLAGNTAFAVGLWHSWRVGSRHGVLLAGWSLLGSLAGIYDWLLQNNLTSIEGMFLGAYANVGAFFIFSYVMFSRYVGAIGEVERVNASLEASLQAREAELTQSHQRLREIERREVLGQERQRMMQDMHDGLGSSLRIALWSVEQGQLDDTMVADVLKSCIDDLKLAIDSMEPVQADLLLLLATWRYRLEPRLENTGIALRWEVVDVPELNWLDPNNALHILRILQEAFSNILKHAHATQIRVATRSEADGVVVTIADNGRGFDPQPTRPGGKGLANQTRRAASIGAKIDWASGAQGTCLSLWLPLQRDPQKPGAAASAPAQEQDARTP